MGLTGGQLNILNGGSRGISAPDKSVPVMKLIKVHKPKSKEELVNLIKDHSIKKCECGIVSKGTIEDFGKNLYDAQLPMWGEHKYTLQECITWEYHLFVTQSLKGNYIENKAKDILSKELKGLSIEDVDNYYDEELRIDLEIKKSEKTIAGIQVKPSSYMKVRKEVQFMNQHRNELVDYPVFYLYYDYDSENFLNLSFVINNIQELKGI